MALLAYALSTVDKLLSFMGGQILPEEDLFRVYHDGTGGATSATVQVFATQVQLVTNLGTSNVTFAANPTITDVVAAINALGGNRWVATAISGRGVANSSDLSVVSATSAYLIAAEQHLIGRNVLSYEQAVNAATEMIERFCGRRFALTTHEHKVSGSGRRELSLREHPISAVARVSSGFREYLSVLNSSTDATQATGQTIATALHLTVTGGVNASSSSLLFTTNVTIGALITAINALGNGWTATLSSGSNNAFLTADLFEHDPRSALNRALTLRAGEETINNFEVDKDAGVLLMSSGPDATRFSGATAFGFYGRITPFELRPITARGSGPLWREGFLNYFVRYTAGFSTIPADLEFFCNQVAANLLRAGKRDTALGAESLDGYSYSTKGEPPLTEEIRKGLFSYKNVVGVEFAAV